MEVGGWKEVESPILIKSVQFKHALKSVLYFLFSLGSTTGPTIIVIEHRSTFASTRRIFRSSLSKEKQHVTIIYYAAKTVSSAKIRRKIATDLSSFSSLPLLLSPSLPCNYIYQILFSHQV